jgi:adenylylsulfate kinase-like enzyme
MIYWFTGQPGHGKTTLAKRVVEEYNKFGKHIFHIDGDDLRKLTLNQDYTPSGRIDNVRGAYKIALYLHNSGHDVVVSIVSPYRYQRDEVKYLTNEGGVTEFYVHTTELRERDMYKVVEYEPPIENFVDIDTTNVSVEDSFLIIKPYLRL